MIHVDSKKKSLKTLGKLYPNAKIIDVTSKGEKPWVKVSPFYPHGGIPVPHSQGSYAMSVEGIWQGLKVFETEDIDISKFEVKNMKGIKRTVRKFGKPLGHRKGVNGTELLDYVSARKQIYLVAYAWMLDNTAQDVIQLLKSEAEKNDIVLLDYDTNGEIENTNRPLSHASLVKRYLYKKYPELSDLVFELKPDEKKSLTKEKKKRKSSIKSTLNSKRLDSSQLELNFG